MTVNDSLKQISKTFAASFNNVSEKGAVRIREYRFDCSELDDYTHVDITKSEKFKALFDDLKQINGPAIYFFEILSDHSPNTILSKVNAYSALGNSRAIPATKKSIAESRVLYVGKVKRHMYGRVIQHLGFYPVGFTQGLQLFYWAKEISLSVKLTVLEFEPDMVNLMGVLEYELALQLKPILGKHK